jgi:general secretion pathway protein I
MNIRASRGFTLVEVLVALAVVALALLGLTKVAALQAANADALRQRTLAGWVAANVLVETRLAAGLPPTGRSDGRVELGAHRWRWKRDVGSTPDPQVRRVDVTVFADDDAREPVVSLSGFAQTAVSP